ncbi:Nucleolar protein 56 [Fukomys damarensis]|uniref:Nucleolar protein 56 n=1 Tax=Fukomys damarensis TaxID=885580 RepID=A0A091DLT2_FUKDA|nr:Nucleolar protein 56 [Fukomys damarensis]
MKRQRLAQRKRLFKELSRKLEKQEKHLKEENKWLATLATASSENSSSIPEEWEETHENPKKKKRQSSRMLLGRTEWMAHLSLPPNPGMLVSSDLRDTAVGTSLPKLQRSSPKEEPVSEPEEAVGRKKRTFSFKEEPINRGPEDVPGSKGSAKKKTPKGIPGRVDGL